MGRTEGSFEKKELAGRSPLRIAMAYKFGKKGMDALRAGVWPIAETFKGRASGISKQSATVGLIELMEEAARTSDGTKLRLLADAVEARKYCNAHDPLRATIFAMLPLRMFGIESPAEPPRTAEEIQDSIRSAYPPGEVPTLKTVREVAVELGVTLTKKKRGAPPGVRRKSPNRAKR